MKRCISLALILALFMATLALPALAEEMELAADDAEASVAEIGDLEGAEPPADAPEGTLADLEGPAPADSNIAESTAPAAAAGEASAGEADPQTADITGSRIADAIQMDRASVAIGVGEKYEGLTLSALPEGSALPDITWRSGNKKVARVNAQTGVVTGVKKGSTYIYAKMAGGDAEVRCKVVVRPAPKKITVDKSVALSVGMSAQLTPAIPKGYASGKLIFGINKKTVAVVDGNGLVTAVAPGAATITVKTFNGKKAKCAVEVMPAPATVAFPDTLLPMAVDQTATLAASGLTADGEVTPAVITYAIDERSADAGCVSLDPATGELTAVRKGQAVVNAIAHNGVVGKCTVEVDIGPESVALNTESIAIGVKEVYPNVLAECVAPAGAGSCAQVVTWVTSNSRIAKIDPVTGAVTGVKAGSCKIAAVAPNGQRAECAVKVLKAPGKGNISISPVNGVLKVGMLGQYKIKLDKGYGGSLAFKSSNPGVATIDSTGIVTAVAVGQAKITVTTYNGVSKTANLKVYSDGSADGGKSDGKKSGESEKIQYMLEIAQTKLNKPYVYGNFGPNAFDCSGFVYWCYKQINITLENSAYRQGYDTRYPKIAYSDLQPGDLVFFNTVEDGDLSDHSGLYLGGGKFIHASSSAGKVIISKLTSGYYHRNFSWGRRVFY